MQSEMQAGAGSFNFEQLDCSRLWESIVGEPGLGVAVVTKTNVVEFGNAAMARLWLRDPEVQILGKSIPEILPEALAEQAMKTIARVAHSDTRIVRRIIWGGKPIQATYSWINGVGGADGRVFITARVGYVDFPEGQEGVIVEDSPLIELGPLNVLTNRELEVLAMLGRGMRIKEIADTLHRSPKTIENHKDAIGRKLNETDRARLTRIAVEAGLDPHAAELKRIKVDRPHRN